MRTKTLLLTAAVSAAGISGSLAQVFSVNAVGYVNTKIPAGKLALISNPLDAGAGNNTVAKLFAGVPDGTQIYKFNGTGYEIASFDGLDGVFDKPNITIEPGEGVFVRNNSAAEITVTFVGEVKQGSLSNPLPNGLSIRSSQVPQTGNVADLGFPATDGDQIFKFNVATQGYAVYGFDGLDNAWLLGSTAGAPVLNVGEAVFVRKNGAANWTRTFNINQ